MTMKRIFNSLLLILSAAVLSQCAQDGEYDHPINKNVYPDVPVTFTGATTMGANPYYVVAYQAGAGTFEINISIPEDSEVNIQEITSFSAGTTALTPGNLVAGTNSGTAAKYNAAPIVVNGKTATITSDIPTFNSKFPATGAARIGATLATGTTYTERAFMFLLTMSDGSQVISQQVRIRITY
jgi:hypothetical protein